MKIAMNELEGHVSAAYIGLIGQYGQSFNGQSVRSSNLNTQLHRVALAIGESRKCFGQRGGSGILYLLYNV